MILNDNIIPNELGLAAQRASAYELVSQEMRRQPLWVALLLPLLLVGVLGLFDYISGWEVSLFIFYAVPITIAVWWAGTKAGLITALFAGVVWWMANNATQPYSSQMGYVGALINREFYFCIVVYTAFIVRGRQEMDATRIELLEDRRRLEHEILMVSEYEQQRIGQDLHDGLCQQLAAIGCAVHALAEDLQARQQAEAIDAVHVEEAIKMAVLEARGLARGIFPVHVDRTGLAMSLQDLARTTSRLTAKSIHIDECVDVRIDNPEVAMHLYRIAQEAVANAVRHSEATEISLFLTHQGDTLELRIEDNGRGFTSVQKPKLGQGGMGLRTMQYRADTLGAKLSITPRPAGGTVVSCLLKVKTQSEHEIA